MGPGRSIVLSLTGGPLRRTLLTSSALLAAACVASPDLAPEAFDPTEVARGGASFGGCGDLDLYASRLAETQALFVSVAGAASAATTPAIERYTLPDPDVRAELQVGEHLVGSICSGVPPIDPPSVRGRASATSGTLVLRLTPDPSGGPLVMVDARLRDAIFEDPGSGWSTRVGEAVWRDVEGGVVPP